MKKLVILFVLFGYTYLANSLTSKDVNGLLDYELLIDESKLVDLLDKRQKIDRCLFVYEQSRINTSVKDNLFGLLHETESIRSLIDSFKKENKVVTQKDKIKALGKIQCGIYYSLGML